MKKTLAVILFCFFFDFIYVYKLNPIFTFSRVNLEPNYIRHILAYFFCIFSSLFIPSKSKTFSECTVLLIFVIIIVPSIQISKYISTDFFNLLVIIILPLFTIVFVNKTINLEFHSIDLTPNMKIGLPFFSFLVSMAAFFLTFGFSPKVLTFSSLDVYSVRQNMIVSSHVLIRYVLSWYPSFFLGMIMCLLFLSQRKIIMYFCILLGFYNFSISGHKIYAFLPIVMWILLLMIKKDKGISLIRMIFLYIVSMLGLVLLSFFLESNIYMGIVDRVASVNGDLLAKYYNFFSNHPKAFWGYSFLKNIVDYPYWDWPGKIIGYYEYNSSYMNANANYIADGYANAGLFGVLFYSAFISIFTKIIDGFNPIFIVSGLFSVIFVVLISSISPLTVMLTNGFVWFPLFLFLGLGRSVRISHIDGCPKRPFTKSRLSKR